MAVHDDSARRSHRDLRHNGRQPMLARVRHEPITVQRDLLVPGHIGECGDEPVALVTNERARIPRRLPLPPQVEDPAHAVGPDGGESCRVESIVVVGADQRALADPSTIDGGYPAEVACVAQVGPAETGHRARLPRTGYTTVAVACGRPAEETTEGENATTLA
jgi:hypothetical protein